MSPTGVVLAALCLTACGGGGWKVTENRRVEGLANEVSIWADMTLRSDSGPHLRSAKLTLWCNVPSDPSTQIVVKLDPALMLEDKGFILVRTRIDAGPIAEDTWFATSDGEMAFPREFNQEARYRFTNALWHAQTYRMELPLGGYRGVFRFRTTGFDRAYSDLKRRCKPH